jgi:hypothetical protein
VLLGLIATRRKALNKLVAESACEKEK